LMRSPSSKRRRPASSPTRGKAARCATGYICRRIGSGCSPGPGPGGTYWSIVEPFLSQPRGAAGVEASTRWVGRRGTPLRTVLLLSFAWWLAALGAGCAVRNTGRASLSSHAYAALEAILDAGAQAGDVVTLHGPPLAIGFDLLLAPALLLEDGGHLDWGDGGSLEGDGRLHAAFGLPAPDPATASDAAAVDLERLEDAAADVVGGVVGS